MIKDNLGLNEKSITKTNPTLGALSRVCYSEVRI